MMWCSMIKTMITIKPQIPSQIITIWKKFGLDKAYAINSNVFSRNHNQSPYSFKAEIKPGSSSNQETRDFNKLHQSMRTKDGETRCMPNIYKSFPNNLGDVKPESSSKMFQRDSVFFDQVTKTLLSLRRTQSQLIIHGGL